MSAVAESAARHNGGRDVYAEFWSSFISLLRAYTAAHGLNRGEQAILEVSGDAILVRAGERWLDIKRTGDEGVWNRNTGERVRFRFDDHGRIVTHGHAEEMDVIAERLARGLML